MRSMTSLKSPFINGFSTIKDFMHVEGRGARQEDPIQGNSGRKKFLRPTRIDFFRLFRCSGAESRPPSPKPGEETVVNLSSSLSSTSFYIYQSLSSTVNRFTLTSIILLPQQLNMLRNSLPQPRQDRAWAPFCHFPLL